MGRPQNNPEGYPTMFEQMFEHLFTVRRQPMLRWFYFAPAHPSVPAAVKIYTITL
jgi:hypothetical protein